MRMTKRSHFLQPGMFYTQQKTAYKFNHGLYYVVNTTSRCEFRPKYNLWLNLVLVFRWFETFNNLLHHS